MLLPYVCGRCYATRADVVVQLGSKEDLKGIQLHPDEVMMSFDVKALFTSVPIEPALVIIEKLLKEDQNLQSRTTMSINTSWTSWVYV